MHLARRLKFWLLSFLSAETLALALSKKTGVVSVNVTTEHDLADMHKQMMQHGFEVRGLIDTLREISHLDLKAEDGSRNIH